MIFSYILICTCKAECTKIKRRKKVCTCDKQWSMIGHMFQGLSEFELALRKREKKRVLFFPLRLIIRIRMHYHTPQTRKIYYLLVALSILAPKRQLNVDLAWRDNEGFVVVFLVLARHFPRLHFGPRDQKRIGYVDDSEAYGVGNTAPTAHANFILNLLLNFILSYSGFPSV